MTLLVANKKDLSETRQVSFEEGEKKAKEHGLAFMETSAKDGEGVEKAFLWMVREVKERMEKNGATRESQIGSQVKEGMRLDTRKIVKMKKGCEC